MTGKVLDLAIANCNWQFLEQLISFLDFKVFGHSILDFWYFGIMADATNWIYENVIVLETDYSKKLGIKGDCYFWMTRDAIEIEQKDTNAKVKFSFSKVRYTSDDTKNQIV